MSTETPTRPALMTHEERRKLIDKPFYFALHCATYRYGGTGVCDVDSPEKVRVYTPRISPDHDNEDNPSLLWTEDVG